MTDAVVRMLTVMGYPVTRENYIDLAWAPVPEPWTPELEAELPEELQDWTRFEERNGELVARSDPTEAVRAGRTTVHVHRE